MLSAGSCEHEEMVTVAVGSNHHVTGSGNSKKVIRVEGVYACDDEPANAMLPDASERWSVTVGEDEVVVRRVDRDESWQVDLHVTCYRCAGDWAMCQRNESSGSWCR